MSRDPYEEQITQDRWVRMRLLNSKFDISLRVIYLETPKGGYFEFIDFRAPGHPEVDWDWIDAHQGEIFSQLPF